MLLKGLFVLHMAISVVQMTSQKDFPSCIVQSKYMCFALLVTVAYTLYPPKQPLNMYDMT